MTFAHLDAWRDVERPIISKGKNESWDGCYWLLHAENVRHALFVPAAAPEIRQASGSLVHYCEARANSR